MSACDVWVAVCRLTGSGVENCHRRLSPTTTHLKQSRLSWPVYCLQCLCYCSRSVLSCFLGCKLHHSYIASTNHSSWPSTRSAVPKISPNPLWNSFLSHILNTSLDLFPYFLLLAVSHPHAWPPVCIFSCPAPKSEGGAVRYSFTRGNRTRRPPPCYVF